MFFPLLGQWERYENIDFSKLPSSFVLKCNHDSGSVRIIEDKTQINHKELKKYFNKRLKCNPYYVGREYPYRHIKPMILAEQNMNLDNPNGINDYKFFCFNGEPQFMYIATERNSACKFDFFDMDFNRLDITNIHPHSNKDIDKPICFDEMKNIAKILAQGIPFVRIDLYEINGKIYFGEYTFFHGGGFWPFKPEKWELKYGDMISLKLGGK